MTSKVCCCHDHLAFELHCIIVEAVHVLQVVSLRRQATGRDRERSHLLSLYASLCSCINSKELRVRELVQDVLQLAGDEVGLFTQ